MHRIHISLRSSRPMNAILKHTRYCILISRPNLHGIPTRGNGVLAKARKRRGAWFLCLPMGAKSSTLAYYCLLSQMCEVSNTSKQWMALFTLHTGTLASHEVCL